MTRWEDLDLSETTVTTNIMSRLESVYASVLLSLLTTHSSPHKHAVEYYLDSFGCFGQSDVLVQVGTALR